jgi:hypothetical protein
MISVSWVLTGQPGSPLLLMTEAWTAELADRRKLIADRVLM